MEFPFLSICIPTFNRDAYLEACLASLAESWAPGVEIVVSDNASSDNTVEVLNRYAMLLPMTWQRQPRNVGFDRNCAAVVSMAKGQYCWLLGSDDCVAPGALLQAMEQLRKYSPDIFHFGYVQADLDMNPISHVMVNSFFQPVPLTRGPAAAYIESLPNVSMAFAFISCFVFRRELWVSRSSILPSWLESHYVHMYMLHAMIADNATILSSNKCLVFARGGNPNEWNTTPGKLLSLDAITLMRVWREIYRDANHLRALGTVFRRSYPARFLVNVASRGGISYLRSYQSELEALGCSKLLIRALLLLEARGAMPLVKRLISLRRRLFQFLSNH